MTWRCPGPTCCPGARWSAERLRSGGDEPALWGEFWRNLAIALEQRLAETNRLIDHCADLEQLLRDKPDFRELYGRS